MALPETCQNLSLIKGVKAGSLSQEQVLTSFRKCQQVLGEFWDKFRQVSGTASTSGRWCPLSRDSLVLASPAGVGWRPLSRGSLLLASPAGVGWRPLSRDSLLLASPADVGRRPLSRDSLLLASPAGVGWRPLSSDSLLLASPAGGGWRPVSRDGGETPGRRHVAANASN